MSWDAVLALIGVVSAALIGAVSDRVSSRSEERTKRLESRGPEWSALMDEMQEWTRERLAERDEVISRMEKRMSTLQESLEQVGRKYRHSLDHIRVLRHGHPDPPALPESIAEDV